MADTRKIESVVQLLEKENNKADVYHFRENKVCVGRISVKFFEKYFAGLTDAQILESILVQDSKQRNLFHYFFSRNIFLWLANANPTHFLGTNDNFDWEHGEVDADNLAQLTCKDKENFKSHESGRLLTYFCNFLSNDDFYSLMIAKDDAGYTPLRRALDSMRGKEIIQIVIPILARMPTRLLRHQLSNILLGNKSSENMLYLFGLKTKDAVDSENVFEAFLNVFSQHTDLLFNLVEDPIVNELYHEALGFPTNVRFVIQLRQLIGLERAQLIEKNVTNGGTLLHLFLRFWPKSIFPSREQELLSEMFAFDRDTLFQQLMQKDKGDNIPLHLITPNTIHLGLRIFSTLTKQQKFVLLHAKNERNLTLINVLFSFDLADSSDFISALIDEFSMEEWYFLQRYSNVDLFLSIKNSTMHDKYKMKINAVNTLAQNLESLWKIFKFLSEHSDNDIYIKDFSACICALQKQRPLPVLSFRATQGIFKNIFSIKSDYATVRQSLEGATRANVNDFLIYLGDLIEGDMGVCVVARKIIESIGQIQQASRLETSVWNVTTTIKNPITSSSGMFAATATVASVTPSLSLIDMRLELMPLYNEQRQFVTEVFELVAPGSNRLVPPLVLPNNCALAQSIHALLGRAEQYIPIMPNEFDLFNMRLIQCSDQTGLNQFYIANGSGHSWVCQSNSPLIDSLNSLREKALCYLRMGSNS